MNFMFPDVGVEIGMPAFVRHNIPHNRGHAPRDNERYNGFAPYVPQATDGTPAYEPSCNTVSALYKCETKNAKKLCLYDIGKKLRRKGDYDIGGTYNDGPEFWFHYKTSVCPGNNHLLNLCVFARKEGNFSIGISNSNFLIHKDVSRDHTGKSVLSDELSWHSFKCSKKDELFFIKTFCFSEQDVKVISSRTLFIPIEIITDIPITINNDFLLQIKMNHDIGERLLKLDNKDFKLESASGKQYDVHRIVLAAHSPVLRNLVVDSTLTSAKIDGLSDEDMELLIEFLYTGSITNIMEVDFNKLVALAEKFQLRSMFVLTQHVIMKQIQVDNAMEIALLSEKYNLESLQKKVFDFIQRNPEVLESDGWKNLDNVALTKKMYQYMFINNKLFA